MRLTLLCFLLTVLGTCVRAQNFEDFAPFRPGTSYNYDNPFLEDEPANSSVSPVLGFHWPGFFGLTGEPTINKVAISSAIPGNVRVIPHFVGSVLEDANDDVWTMYFTERTEPPFFFTLDFGADVGEVFMVNETVRATVDSMVATTFFGLTDDVKYISLLDTVEGVQHPAVQISRNYGMLSGPYFSDLKATTEPLRLVGLSGETNFGDGMSFGADYLEPVELAFAASEVYQEETKPELLNGVAGIRIFHRQWTAGNPGCDPVAGASFTPYRVREINYFVAEAGGAPYDSTVVQSYQGWQGIEFTPYDTDWRALPLGSVYTAEDGTTRVVLPAEDDCLGNGLALGDKLLGDEDVTEMTVDPATAGTAYFRHSLVPAFEPATETHGQRRIVGIDFGDEVCGTVFDFEPLYVSTTDFPDDPLITLAPNPATDRVMITVPFEHGSVRLAVYDAAGRLLRNTSATGGDRWLNVTDLAAGVYTIVVNGAEGPLARRRVVVR